MRLDIHEENKIAIIWAASDENTDVLPPEIASQLEPLRSKHKKFRVIIMHSGSDELFEPMLTLLLRNRMKKALNEVRGEKNSSPSPLPHQTGCQETVGF